MTTPTRHEQLLAAGWIYDAATDRYREPGSADDGMARMRNLEAAWLEFQASQQQPASTPPTRTRAADPRRQEPQ